MYVCLYFYSYINTYIFSNNFYAIATCLKKKRTRSPFRMHGYPTGAFDSSLVTYIERDVLRKISNDIILVHFHR